MNPNIYGIRVQQKPLDDPDRIEAHVVAAGLQALLLVDTTTAQHNLSSSSSQQRRKREFLFYVHQESDALLTVTPTATPQTPIASSHPLHGPVRFIEYCPPVFQALRTVFEERYPEVSFRVDVQRFPVEEWTASTSLGKSSSRFYFFGNVVLKSLKTEEWNHIKRRQWLEQQYLPHVSGGHATCMLPRYYTMMRIKWTSGKEPSQRFVAFNNVLAAMHVIPFCYDLKGSTVGRTAAQTWTTSSSQLTTPPTNSPTSPPVDSAGSPVPPARLVLKDNDLPTDGVLLRHMASHEATSFLNTVAADSAFLCQHSLVDYSLLIGILPRGIVVAEKRDWDSSEEVQVEYHVGIVDILQPFNAKKRLEATTKCVVSDNASVVPPSEYSKRFNRLARKLVTGEYEVMT